MTVLDYFVTTLPSFDIEDERNRAAMEDMPLESTCGDDCKAALDAAAALVKSHRMAFGDDGAQDQRMIVAAAVEACGCLITG